MAKEDKQVKVIINARILDISESPNYGIITIQCGCSNSHGADFQDPPELIYDFIKKWEEGNKLVLGIKIKVMKKN